MNLTLTNLTKQYGSFTALQNFNYEFIAGVYGLLGPNGAGKSTLMNIITDNLKATSGLVRFDGEDYVPIQCIGTGTVDCPLGGKTKFVMIGYSLE